MAIHGKLAPRNVAALAACTYAMDHGHIVLLCAVISVINSCALASVINYVLRNGVTHHICLCKGEGSTATSPSLAIRPGTDFGDNLSDDIWSFKLREVVYPDNVLIRRLGGPLL
jgi:hypothetical protein